ncbi:SPbeta prophage-derived DNA-binding protein HU 2 [Hyphomicrobiales bacterium]|jgi:DNA-binding protein HU-beta|nr:SPbeta prophage-derived DNA-binding protein HU 2 [Hyphomicrobiales bacterium]CAH1702606.1 SPbeta prophage-derived DNA-binding protein HU 2 [Hyphomicrobiales bacterium]CAI0346809.1 SPbeta prophage-derived DNA-binding protein HU 2 [Hyphomicrobiales bacterium]
MNRNELVASVAEKTGLTKGQSEEALKAVLETLATAVKAGDKVSLPGWLTISVADRPERVARNPSTGASITVPAKKVVKVKPGSNLAA